jgi:pimeloyl-ACP methyl ester carboxylesterase
MQTTTSKDGTTLAFDRVGTGPALVFVPGVFNLRDTCAPVAAELRDAFTCFTYDRRARGDSGNVRPYAVEREVEDLQAVLDVAGGRAWVFGYSSGAVLALRAVADGLPADRLFLYEPPFRFEGEEPWPQDGFPDELQQMVDDGRTADVVTAFQLRAIGLPPHVVEGIRSGPFFPGLQAVAQSVVHDAVITTSMPVPTAAMAAVDVPTVVLRGARTAPRLVTSAERLAALLPSARLQVLEAAADHVLHPAATADAVRGATGLPGSR